jgi:pimeloyl-ACP methyl ester carboxylesterase
MSTAATHYLDVPGASIYYEVRGSGPLLALIAAPMGGSGFAALVELMAQHYTVVTYDPRGSEHTTVTDRTEITTPELLAEDVHRVLQTVSDEPAAILGSSGGAVTGWRSSPRTRNRSASSSHTSRPYTEASTKIVVGVGATSAGQLAHRGGLALAEHLGLTPTEFPGDHGGFAAEAPAFAERLRQVLAD